LAVPAVVDVAAVGRVVGGELGLATRRVADPAPAEGADGDVGTDGAPAGGARCGHGVIVPRPEQGKPSAAAADGRPGPDRARNGAA
jgi:hypothetical protein